MKPLLNEKKLTLINFGIVSYFMVLYLLNFYKIDVVLIGVFRELLTIPFLIAQLVFLVVSLKFLIKNKPSYLIVISALSLTICTIITIGSFF